jgi:intracellular sulfur oxidation DsrE/DsrF family protein
MKKAWRRCRNRWLVVGLVACALFAVGLGIGGVVANPETGEHRIVFQVNADDPVPMKHVVSNSINLITQYRKTAEPVKVEIVVYGPGISMFRTDTSPVREILEYMHANFPEITFSVCGSTKSIIEEREGHALSFIEGTRVVPLGILRLVELQEAGWSYIRP